MRKYSLVVRPKHAIRGEGLETERRKIGTSLKQFQRGGMLKRAENVKEAYARAVSECEDSRSARHAIDVVTSWRPTSDRQRAVLDAVAAKYLEKLKRFNVSRISLIYGDQLLDQAEGWNEEKAFAEYDVYLPREKADFNFLDFVNDYEKTTCVEDRVDFLLVTTELLRRRSLTFALLVEMTLREEKFVREAVTEWAGQNVLLASDEAEYCIFAPNALRKMTGKSVYLRQTDAEIEARRHKLKSMLRSEGTIWNDLVVMLWTY